ncbi:MAG: beta-propeller domain-containing protein, partial [Candidatus Aenigmarchaeota archaeon]|nr:beta-propeller domain-containing protein [Candidatus Aenigmarchaeota archaeon]
MGNNVKILSLLIALFLALSALFFLESFKTQAGDRTALKKFSSYEDMKNFVKAAELQGGFYGGPRILEASAAEASAQAAAKGGGSEGYSRTNIQVEGVDEADIIKSDGKYLYIVSRQSLVIIDAYPADSAKILATAGLNGTAQELFINGDKLVVFGYSYDVTEPQPLPAQASRDIAESAYYPYYRQKFFMKVFDVSNIESPEMRKDLKMDADYYDSRMIGDYVYVIVSQPLEFREGVIPLPLEYAPGTARPVFDYDDVYYFDYPDYAYRFTDIIAFNIKDDAQELSHNPYLLGYAQNLFVSQNNIYITGSKHVPQSYFVDALVKEAILPFLPAELAAKMAAIQEFNLSASEKSVKMGDVFNTYMSELTEKEKEQLGMNIQKKTAEIEERLEKERQKTVVHKIAVKDGKVEYKAFGEVPGTPLNQFSMDEHNGYFRIATTTRSLGSFGGSIGVATTQTAVKQVTV